MDSAGRRSEHVAKIFWPLHLCQPISESGYLVGWDLGGDEIVVASKTSFANALQVSQLLADFHQQSVASLELDAAEANGAFRGRSQADQQLMPPTIVGYMSREGEGLCEPEARDACEHWIDAFTARTQIAFRAVLSMGAVMSERVIVILYEESSAKPWHYYKASPINLDLTALASGGHSKVVDHGARTRLQHALDYVNTAGQVLAYLQGSPQGAARRSLRTAVWTTIASETNRQAFERSQASANALFAWASSTFIMLSAYLLRVLDLSAFGFRVKEVSAVGQQVDLIVRRMVYLIEQWRASYHTPKPAHGRRHNAQYAGFWNSVWVIAADIVLGCALGIFLVMCSQAVGDWIVLSLEQYTVKSLESTILWLRGWPAGLKLNNGLDGFLAELFLWLIHFWTAMFQPVTKYMRIVVILAGWSGFVGGCSMQLAIFSDAMALTTLHTYWFYMVATRIFHWQLLTLYSLFNLFRGRKHNVLRNRIDSCDYDLDQLLIGTILFTLLTYLFPTVLVYYATFAGRRVAVIMAQGLFEILLGILNHCPIFYIMLRLRDPQMFPGGVSYNVSSKYALRFIEAAWSLPGSPVRVSRDPIPLSARNRLNTTIIQMEPASLPLSALFFQYYQIWVQFSASYLSLGLLRSLMVGDVVRPVPRLQHTMIPGLSSPHEASNVQSSPTFASEGAAHASSKAKSTQ
ncbi:pig-Q [Coemansia spiralis]|uniref:Pig-Q n=2 Tax=Coemansia TaxID=4863 RepID=A0A9W8GMI8_9FUNG|nr:pig-Q [Coemansia spiralis]